MRARATPAFVGMPTDGLWRAGRWADVEQYVPPRERLGLGLPRLDGERWEDAAGRRFATAKCSANPKAAIARSLAQFRAPEEPETVEVEDNAEHGIINRLLAFLSGPADEGDPWLTTGEVPPDVNDDLYLIRVPEDLGVVFVDLEDPQTVAALDDNLGGVFSALGVDVDLSNISREVDRRITRMVTTALHSQYADGSAGPVAGLRYPGYDNAGFEAFVLWSPPQLVELVGEDISFRWVSAWDADYLAACQHLGLRPPRV